MILWSALVLTMLLTPAASAQVPVYRCVGAHGETVYSGQPCIATNMASQAADASATDNNDWLQQCAASAKELRYRVAAAFDRQDVNLLGGLFLWRGIGNRSAYAHMRELNDLVHQPLAGLSIGGAPAWQADSGGYGSLPDAANVWVSITTSDAHAEASTQPYSGAAPLTEHQFALIESNACVWLSF